MLIEFLYKSSFLSVKIVLKILHKLFTLWELLLVNIVFDDSSNCFNFFIGWETIVDLLSFELFRQSDGVVSLKILAVMISMCDSQESLSIWLLGFSYPNIFSCEWFDNCLGHFFRWFGIFIILSNLDLFCRLFGLSCCKL